MSLSLLLLPSAISAQQHFEKQPALCPIPKEHIAAVTRLLDQAVAIKPQLQTGNGQGYTTTHLLDAFAVVETCVDRFDAALHDADAAYPAGSDALRELGIALVDAGRSQDAVPFGTKLRHGNHSLLFGAAEELAHKGDFTEALSISEKIDSPEVRSSAEQEIAAAMYAKGSTAEADALIKKLYGQLPSKQQAEMPFDLARTASLIASHQWEAARTQASSLPAEAREAVKIEIATGEADEKSPQAKTDLLDSLKSYTESETGSPFGYLISSRLASLRDFKDSEHAAEVIHDDEWNERAWSTIAIFRAEDGQYVEARAALSHIGKGLGLIHPLNRASTGRDIARDRIANVLLAHDHADIALTFLAELEDTDGVAASHTLPTRVEALVKTGKLTEARVLVEKMLDRHKGFVSEEDFAVAATFVQAWYTTNPSAAEAWVKQLTNVELQFSCWLALIKTAAGEKPALYYYFVNWD